MFTLLQDIRPVPSLKPGLSDLLLKKGHARSTTVPIEPFYDKLAKHEGPGVARGKNNARKQNFVKKFRFFLAYVTPWLPMSVLKKIQPIRSGRLDGQGEHYMNVLFYFI